MLGYMIIARGTLLCTLSPYAASSIECPVPDLGAPLQPLLVFSGDPINSHIPFLPVPAYGIPSTYCPGRIFFYSQRGE